MVKKALFMLIVLCVSLPNLVNAQEKGFPPEFSEKVIYYDPGYDFRNNVHNPMEVIDFFEKRGFEIKNAEQLAKWMKEKVKKGAYGTVCFIGMGIVPESVLWEGVGVSLKGKTRLVSKYIDENGKTLIREYMEAGGRVVWPTWPLCEYQGEENTVKKLPGHSGQGHSGRLWLADIRVHPVWHGWNLRPGKGMYAPPVTEEGKKWGLQRSYNMLLPVLADTVTEAFTLDRLDKETSIACFFLKTLNPEYPGSGIIGLSTDTYGNDRQQMEDFYRLTLYSGKPVEVPVVKEPVEEKKIFNIQIGVFDIKNRSRSAFARTEDVTFRIMIGNKSNNEFTGKVKLSVEDRTGYKLLDNEERCKVDAGGESNIETKWSTGNISVGDYNVTARVLEENTGKELAREISELYIRPMPRKEGVFIGPWFECSDNSARHQKQINKMGESGLAACLTRHRIEGADLLLRYDIPFMLRLESSGVNWRDVTLPQHTDIKGAGYHFGQPEADAFAPQVIAAIGKSMAGQVAKFVDMPNLLPYATGFDDWGAHVGWNWAPHIAERFKKWSGLDIEDATPASIAATRPRFSFHKDYCVIEPKGLIDSRHPWLLWNLFTADQYAGKACSEYLRYMQEVLPEIYLGPIPGGIYFFPPGALYAPLSFGKDKFNLLSYYWYLGGDEPQFRHIYWIELGKAGNRSLPSSFTSDMYLSSSEIPSYIRSSVFAGLAAGTKIIIYFRWEEAQAEAKEELFRLGKQLRNYMELFGRIKPSGRKVGLLVPFSNTIFDGDYALQHCATVFENLLCSHIDIEPVVEEEVLNGYVNPVRYKAIILSDVDWLRKDVAKKLEGYIKAGGIAILDRMTEVPVNGAERLDIDLVFGVKEPVTEIQKDYGTLKWKNCNSWAHSCRYFGNLKKPYGNANMLTTLRNELYKYIEPEIQSESDTLIIRKFKGADAEYLWLVNVESEEEHDMIRRGAYEQNIKWDDLISYLKKQDSEGIFRTTISLPKQDYIIYDVLSGKRLKLKEENGRVIVPVEMQRFGGTLLALLDKEITGIKITGPRNINTGTPAIYKVKVDGPKIGLIPVEVKVISPRGEEKEYSKAYLSQKGEIEVAIRPAKNDVSGAWTIKAKELYSGRETSIKIKKEEI